jgi:predicted cytidylate kinase
MRITLSGDLGSGKSSVGRQLAQRLGAPHFSAGTLFREIGQISNLDALNANLAAENNAAIDHAVDGRTREIDRLHESFVIDSRMAWHFVTDAIKVYLSASPRTAAQRIVSDKSRSSEVYESVASAIVALDRRRESEIKRYRKLYGVDIGDVGNYDLVIVTDDAKVDDIADLILSFAKGETNKKWWLPKPRIVPMIRIEAARAARATAPPRSLAVSFELPLLLAGNFGFFFDDAATFIAALNYKRPLVPFVVRHPRSLKAGDDPIALAKRSLSAARLRAWEVEFDQAFTFGKCLAEF